MIKIFRLVLSSAILLTGFSVSAQTTTSSPYSQFGLGDLKYPILPQQRAIGGLGAGIRQPGAYANINFVNPASYSAIRITTFDIGGTIGLRQLSRNDISETGGNASFSHIGFAASTGRKSAIVAGLVPYSELGYSYRVPGTIDTNNVSYVYSGDGGLSKALIGYGFQIGKHLSVGANLGYVFGKLGQFRTAEFEDFSALNTRLERNSSISGFTYDYGVQFTSALSGKTRLTLGYSGNSGSKINSVSSNLSTTWRYTAINQESGPLDTLSYSENERIKVDMPLTHTVGFVLENTNHWLVGADVNLGEWSSFASGNTNGGLNDSFGVGVGGQFTPDPTAVNYFKVVDYRLGIRYDKTPVRVANTDITQTALTLGFGFPLPANRTSFYKINFSTELGQRGTLDNNLIRERFVNFHIGFTLNDQRVLRAKYD